MNTCLNTATAKPTCEMPLDSEIVDASMMHSEHLLQEYLIRTGVMVDQSLPKKEDPEYQRKIREHNYQNVESLLKQYRTLKVTYEYYKEEFFARVSAKADDSAIDLADESVFDRLSQNLDMLSVTDEKKFQSVWAPQIAVGRRIETALNALSFGMSILKKEDEDLYNLLHETYLEGDRTLPVRTLLNTLHYSSPATYYTRRQQAIKQLTRSIFGCTTAKSELMSILVFLRQQYDDEYFPFDFA